MFLSVTTPGTLAGTRIQVLSFALGGRLSSINTRPGEHVRAGSLLAALQPDELQLFEAPTSARRDEAAAQVAQAQARLEALRLWQKPWRWRACVWNRPNMRSIAQFRRCRKSSCARHSTAW